MNRSLAEGRKMRVWLGMVLLTCAGASVADYWVEVAPLPAVCRRPAVGALNNALYSVGGMTDGNVAQSNVFRFDGANWTAIRGLPDGKGLGAAAVCNNSLYFIGEKNDYSAKTLYCYNGTNWIAITNLPIQFSWFEAAGYNGAIYIMGGADQTHGTLESVTNVYRYDVTGAVLTAVAGLPAPRATLNAIEYGGYLYALGGYDCSLETVTFNTNVYRFDGTHWAEVLGLPSNRYCCGLAVWSNSLYAIGGVTEAAGARSVPTTIFRYDGSSWTTKHGISRSAMGAGVLGGQLYAVAGSYDNLIEHGRSNVFRYTLLEVLPAPSNLTASCGTYTSKVAVSWSAVPGASWYEVLRHWVNNVADATGGGGVWWTPTSYDDASWGIYNGTMFYYWVRAINEAGHTSAVSRVAAGYCRVPETGAILGQPAGGDYDGDGLADPAVYHLASGHLYAWLSTRQYERVGPCGPFQVQPGDLPAPGDYDGDGKADPAVYDFVAGHWYIWLSGSAYQRVGPCVFGVAEYENIAAPADFDGDGKTDPTVYRAATGEWTFWLSRGNYAKTGPLPFYEATARDEPAPGRYDGAVCASPAVFETSLATWTVWMAGDNYRKTGPVEIGDPGLLQWVVPADYDGDGKCDPAVYWPADTLWLVWSSRQNYSLIQARLN